MNRYIDVDKLAHMVACNGDADFINKVTKLMVEAPSINIVRCKECKAKDEKVWYCNELDIWIDENDYCSRGERKEE